MHVTVNVYKILELRMKCKGVTTICFTLMTNHLLHKYVAAFPLQAWCNQYGCISEVYVSVAMGMLSG